MKYSQWSRKVSWLSDSLMWERRPSGAHKLTKSLWRIETPEKAHTMEHQFTDNVWDNPWMNESHSHFDFSSPFKHPGENCACECNCDCTEENYCLYCWCHKRYSVKCESLVKFCGNSSEILVKCCTVKSLFFCKWWFNSNVQSNLELQWPWCRETM